MFQVRLGLLVAVLLDGIGWMMGSLAALQTILTALQVLTVIFGVVDSLIHLSKEPVWKSKSMYGPRILVVVMVLFRYTSIQTVLL